jgi:hypothetical protein
VPFLLAGLALFAGCALVQGQELEPRVYSPSPVGTTFISAGIGRSTGSVLTDTTAPINDVYVSLDSVAISVGRTFGVFGRQALIVGAIPVVNANVSGDVGESRRSVTRNGLADARLKLSIGMFGAKALTLREFATTPRRPVVGASISIIAPSGQYESRHLINLGSHRWSFKPEIGVSYPIRRWQLEAYAGYWFFTTNDSFYPGDAVLTQKPVVAVQAHVSRTVGRAAWLAFDSTWYVGGESRRNGALMGSRQRNSRLGATVSIPLRRTQAVKIAGSTGVATRLGGDFNTIALAWQIVLF